MNNIDFNALPSAVSELLTLTKELKSILLSNHGANEEQKQYMNATKARTYLIGQGIPMSESKLYKLTSQKGIPFRKVGDRLVFIAAELQEWCEKQLIDPRASQNNAILSIVKSAQRQTK